MQFEGCPEILAEVTRRVAEGSADERGAPSESATLASLRHLHESGVLSDADYEMRKADAESRLGGSRGIGAGAAPGGTSAT